MQVNVSPLIKSQCASEQCKHTHDLSSFSARFRFPLYLPYLDTPLFLHHPSFHMYHPPYIPHATLYMFRLLIPRPTCPQSCLINTYSSIVALSYCTWLACLPGHCLTLLALYINCSYFTCRSLICILNKILPFLPLCLPLTPHSPTCAREARPRPRPAPFADWLLLTRLPSPSNNHMIHSL